MTTVDQACAIAAFGWYVFPVQVATEGEKESGKRPLVKWRDRSTNDVDEVRAMWADWPYANIGIDCGKSGLAVLDIDEPEAVPIDIQVRIDCDPEWDTFTVQTHGERRHLYFSDPDGTATNGVKDIPGCDVRGNGGYVVAPGSSHWSGGTYTTINPRRPKPWPARELAEWLDPEPKEEWTPPPATARAPGPIAADGGGTRWGLAMLAEEANRVAGTVKGSRNDTMFDACLRVGSAVKAGELDANHAEQAMLAAARQASANGPDPFTEKEARSCWDGAFARCDARGPDPDGSPPTNMPTGGQTPATTVPSRPDTPMRVMSLDDINDMPPVEWIIPGRIPRGLTIMYGYPGAGKTWVALDWSLSAAAHGRRVLYMAGEGVFGLKNRVRPWRTMHDRTGDAAANWMLSPTLPYLTDRQALANAEQTIAQLRPDLIVLDTWHRTLAGAEENSSTDIGRGVAWLDFMRDQYGTSALVIHHPSGNGGDRAIRVPNPRGSTSLTGSADAMWVVTEDHHIVCKKAKDFLEPPELAFHLRPVQAGGALVEPSAMHHIDWNS